MPDEQKNKGATSSLGVTSITPDTSVTIKQQNGKIPVQVVLSYAASSNTAARAKLYVNTANFPSLPPADASQPDPGGTTTTFNWTGPFNMPTAAILPGTNKLAVWYNDARIGSEWELHVVTIIVSL